MTDSALPHHLDRDIFIRAPRDLVFSFFTDNDRWASWWGAGSTIHPSPGGHVYIRHPNGIETRGRILQIDAPDLIVFTYGYTSGMPIPEGGSTVTIRLVDEADGTRVRLHHTFAEPGVRDAHVQGWRFQLSLFANAVAGVVNADAAKRVDDWFTAWAEPDAGAREAQLAGVAAPTVTFRDQYSCLDGMPELLAHVAAAQHFMPGVRLTRDGAVRHCQGLVLASWVASTNDGQPRGKGTNVFEMAADGRIERVTGFWD
jgi:uncharacterized protein YndB with AHSA1/START domain